MTDRERLREEWTAREQHLRERAERGWVDDWDVALCIAKVDALLADLEAVEERVRATALRVLRDWHPWSHGRSFEACPHRVCSEVRAALAATEDREGAGT